MNRVHRAAFAVAGLVAMLLSSGTLAAAAQPPKPNDPPRGANPRVQRIQPPGMRLEQRLQALEHKLDMLIEEIRQLRHSGHHGSRPGKPAPGWRSKPSAAKPPLHGFHGPGAGPPPKPPRDGSHHHGHDGSPQPPLDGFHGPGEGPPAKPPLGGFHPPGPGGPPKPPRDGFHSPGLGGPPKPPRGAGAETGPPEDDRCRTAPKGPRGPAGKPAKPDKPRPAAPGKPKKGPPTAERQWDEPPSA
jgi:hypothetical protein